jgi:RNA polymerase sigma-70 factor (ECF subfamily)
MSGPEKQAMLDAADTDRDLALVQRFLAGDETAFDMLVSRYRSHVYNICLQMLGNRADAEDAAQEAFVGVYEGLPRFETRSAVSTWVYRIAMNRCVSYRRRRRPTYTIEAEAVEQPEQFDEAEKRRRVREALRQIAPHYRAVLVLKYYRGLSYDEIAEVLGWSPEKVKCYLHRARDRFRRIYSEELEDQL